MKIVRIHPPQLFAVRYDGKQVNVFFEIYERLTDENYLSDFFESFADRISDYVVSELGFERDETEEYIAEVNDRMIDIEEEICQTCRAINEGKRQDFGDFFEPHSTRDRRGSVAGGGKSSKYGIPYLPVKCWGSGYKPSLVRIYAIELARDCYIIIYGGIKIDLDTADCPAFDDEGNRTTLENEIRRRVLAVSDFLLKQGIVDKEGLLQYLEEDDENK